MVSAVVLPHCLSSVCELPPLTVCLSVELFAWHSGQNYKGQELPFRSRLAKLNGCSFWPVEQSESMQVCMETREASQRPQWVKNQPYRFCSLALSASAQDKDEVLLPGACCPVPSFTPILPVPMSFSKHPLSISGSLILPYLSSEFQSLGNLAFKALLKH